MPTQEKPILMSGPMVRAILEGRKTQTRRVVKWPRAAQLCGRSPLPDDERTFADGQSDNQYLHCAYGGGDLGKDVISLRESCPQGQPGDTLWVKEKYALRLDVDWREYPEKAAQYCLYKGTGDPADELNFHQYGPWRSGRFMPRCVCRLFLRIKTVRVERLQEISGDDAAAEGVMWKHDHAQDMPQGNRDNWNRVAFMQLWDSINAKCGYSWASNPWVWVIEFENAE